MTDEGDDIEAMGRERSPRSPFISLSKAIDRAGKFLVDHDRHAVRVENAAATWGYASKSSGGRQTVATLLMYGLLHDTGSGKDRKVQLTNDAWRYFVDERQGERAQLLAKFALTPKIMAELWSAWGSKPPSDAECRSQLRIDLGFTRRQPMICWLSTATTSPTQGFRRIPRVRLTNSLSFGAILQLAFRKLQRRRCPHRRRGRTSAS